MFVYGVDLSKNKVWRIASQGGAHKLDLISDFAVQTILNQFKKRIVGNGLRMLVKTNYDRERNNVIFSYFNEENGLYNTDLYELVGVPDEPGDDNEVDTTLEENGELASSRGDGSTNAAEVAKDAAFREQAVLSQFHPVIRPTDDPVVTTENEDGDVSVINDDGDAVITGVTDGYNKLVPQLWKTNDLGSLYWNETLGKWISRLSWNPLFTWNLQSNLYSFSGTNRRNDIWEHFSENVPRCHFYGDQDKFIFEFMVVDNPSGQKILDNFLFICNREFPGRITYGLMEDDIDYETFAGVDNGYIELMKQRHEPTENTLLGNGNYNLWTPTTAVISGVSYFTISAANGDPISQEECERIAGGYIVYAGQIYVIGNCFENNGIFYNEILDQNGINVLGGTPVGWTFSRIEFGIIKQNMEYIEDHLYVEVGKGESNILADDGSPTGGKEDLSRVRDKAIRVRVMYEGYDYVTVQSIISKFTYSFG
jgi:hypothetical protein